MISTASNLRQYTILSQNDSDNIKNHRCPEYALNWVHNLNQHHWRPGHDYFLGNGDNVTDNLELRQILSEKLARGTLPSKIIFCDLDGVLADFEQGVFSRLKKRPDQLKPGLMWGVINKSNTFFETLPWMPRGRELWEQIKQYDPIILTGTPRSSTAAEQKRKWCARELGPHVHVITCSTKDKPDFCLTNSVLIDDRPDNLNAWNTKGGKFLLYDEESQDKIIERINKHMETDPGLCTP
jgi:5'(3')-deoxyribonucleotidase